MAVTVTGIREIPITDLTRYPGNPRRGDVTAIRTSVRRLGQYRTIVVRDTGDQLVILAGNHTTEALAAEGHATVRCEVLTCDDADARRINLADNRLAELGGYDDDDLAAILAGLDGDFEGTGWTQDDYDALLQAEPEGDGSPDRPSLADRFLIPPFSVLDARQGWWRDRKKAWIGLGIQSELGRGGRLLGFSEQARSHYSGGGGLTFKGQDSLNRIMHEGR